MFTYWILEKFFAPCVGIEASLWPDQYKNSINLWTRSKQFFYQSFANKASSTGDKYAAFSIKVLNGTRNWICAYVVVSVVCFHCIVNVSQLVAEHIWNISNQCDELLDIYRTSIDKQMCRTWRGQIRLGLVSS